MDHSFNVWGVVKTFGCFIGALLIFAFTATSSSPATFGNIQASTSHVPYASEISFRVQEVVAYTVVPNVKGEWQEYAFRKLQKSGLRASGSKIVPGRILIVYSQIPQAGKKVLRGTVVHLYSRLRKLPESIGNRMLDWAETQKGKPYLWGGVGPYGYDCSGLVYAAGLHDGITLPRDTFEMLAGSPHLYEIPLADAHRGDLMFYGSGHVEFDTALYHTTFGAREPGTPVSYAKWNPWWHPTMAFRIR